MIILILLIAVLFSFLGKTGGKKEKMNTRENKIFFENFRKNKKLFDDFMNYICDSGSFDFKENIKPKILALVKKNRSDQEIYKLMKKNFIPREIRTNDPKFKINLLYKMLEKYQGTDIPQTILDIGTEEIRFLTTLEKTFKGSKAYGLNINEGFSHYHKNFSGNLTPLTPLEEKNSKENTDNKTSEGIFEYDGINIPFEENMFDLITIYNVLHHVKPSDLQELIKNIIRVSKKYIFIKEVDLHFRYEKDYFNIQHDLYEGILYEDKKSYRNENFTKKFLIELMTASGELLIIELKEKKDFVGSFSVLFQRTYGSPNLSLLRRRMGFYVKNTKKIV